MLPKYAEEGGVLPRRAEEEGECRLDMPRRLPFARNRFRRSAVLPRCEGDRRFVPFKPGIDAFL